MTINPSENLPKEFEEHPTTPTHDGTLQFLGPDTVKYISPPRIEKPRCRVAPPPVPQPPAPSASAPPFHSSPPSYQSSVYPQMAQMPMMTPQYHQQQMISPQMMYMSPQMMAAPGVMAAPILMAQQPPVQLTPPQVVQQPSPSITLCINQSPSTASAPLMGPQGGGGAAGGALICPKCRKGIITRKQDKFRKRLYLFLSICCCPLTCLIPLICLCRNYVDTCGACGKKYGHRGRKAYKKNVNAVKL